MKLKVWLPIVVSAGLLWYSVRNVEFERAWEATLGMNLFWLIPYALVNVGEVFLRAWRWQWLLAPIQRVSLGPLCSATLIGLMGSNVLPARAGEFLRAYAAARSERMPFSTSFATVVIDRVFDGLTASAIFVFAVLAYPLPDFAKGAGILAAVIYGVTLAVLIGLITQQSKTLRVVAPLVGWLPRKFRAYIMDQLLSFVGGLAVFRNPRLLLLSAALSVVIWVGYGLTLYLMWLAFDIHLSVLDSFVGLLILTIVLTLPSTPGFAGALEAGIVTGLAFFGVDESRAFAVAVVYHVTQWVPATLAGFVALWLARIPLTEIRRAESAERVGAAATAAGGSAGR